MAAMSRNLTKDQRLRAKAYITKRRLWLILVLGLGIGLVVFANGLGGDFVYDDNIVLSHSLFGQPARGLEFFGEPYFEDFPQGGLYRPLTQISFALNFFFGSGPVGFHWFNLLLHVVNSILVFYLISWVSNSFRISLVSFLLFLVLPIHVEAVTSIVGRAELLSFLFVALALFSWFKTKPLILAAFLFLALLAKETAIVLPLILLVLAVFYRSSFKWLWYQLVAIGGYLGLRLWVLGQYAFNAETEFVFNPLEFVSLGERLATALKILILYLQKIFVPFGLTADYSYNQIPVIKNVFNSPWPLAGLLVLAAIVFLIIRSLRKKDLPVRQAGPTVVLGATLFLLPYLLVSNLIFPIGTIMADRLMYLPSLGAVILLAVLVGRVAALKHLAVFGLRRLTDLALVVLLVSFSIVTILQNRVWANEPTLFLDMYQKSPGSVVAKTNWAKTIFSANPAKAEELSRAAYNQYPDFVPNLNLLARLEIQKGNLAEAERLLERAVQLRPTHEETLVVLNRLYFTMEKYEQAERVSQVLVPKYNGKGNTILYVIVQVRNRKYQEAIKTINEYFGENTTDETAKAILGYSYFKLGQPTKVKELGFKVSEIETRFQDIANSFKLIRP